jgi:hypothetical protein
MVRGMDQSIACTLTADAFRDRTELLAALADRALLARAPIPGGERLTFAGDAAAERDLRAAVEAERSCCAFLDLDLRRHEDRLVLDVTGPADARPLITELFA